MDMCLNAPMEGRDWMMSPLLRVNGVGRMGFWSVVNSLTGMDFGQRCSEEWEKRSAQIQRENS